MAILARLVKNMEFGTLTKLKPGDNCQELSPTILRMATHQTKDGHPPEGCILQTRNLALRLNSQNRWKMMEFDTEELILVLLFFTQKDL